MTEDHGVLGSTPRGPIVFLNFSKTFIKTKELFILEMAKKKKSVEKKEKKKEVSGKKRDDEKLGNAGYIIGILSIILGVVVAPIIGIILGIIGFSFCMIQQKRKPTRKAKLGIRLNIIGFVISVLLWIVVIQIVFPMMEGKLNSFPVS